MKQPAKSRIKKVAEGRKKTPMQVKLAVAAGVCSTRAGDDGAGNYVHSQLALVHVLALRRAELHVNPARFVEQKRKGFIHLRLLRFFCWPR